MKKYILILFLFCYNICFAQNEYDHWIIPSQPDYEINFCDSISLNSIDSINSNVVVGGAAISDKKTGQLLFFTDGEQVWNKNFQQMPNGNSLNGGWESAQPALIVPQPGSDSIFYLFTTDNAIDPDFHGLEYSIVDMAKDNGLGDVTVKNIFLDSSCRKLNAVYNATNNSFWVIACDYVTDNFTSYYIDSNGLNTTPVLSPSRVKIILLYQASGYLKSSPDGKSIVTVYEDPPVVGLYNFDKNTGLISLKTFLPLQVNDGQVFGASFSPDNSLLYISAADTTFGDVNSEVYQYNVTGNDTNAIKASRITIDSIYNVRIFAGMQLGPDGKLYITREEKDSIDVIEKPDSLGKSCEFILDKIPLPIANQGNNGFSNNIDGLYYFATPDSNINLSYTVGSNNTVSFTINTKRVYNYFLVNFGDGSDTLLDSTQFTFTHQYNSIGTYTIKLNTASGCSIEDSVTITIMLTSIKSPITAPSFIIPTLIYGDGSQTKWQIINLPQGSNSVTLYDELGRVIYKSLNYPNDFDMRPLPSAMYFYRLTLESGQVYVGKIVLVR